MINHTCTCVIEYLRGRMGLSFYRTMNIPDLVAHNRSHYISIAVRLCENATFLRSMKVFNILKSCSYQEKSMLLLD